MKAYEAKQSAKDPAKWIADAQAANDKYGQGRTYELVSTGETTPSGRIRFTYRVTDTGKR